MDRTSIKAVMPAVWQSNPQLRAHPFFEQYAREEGCQIVDPYKTLPTAIIGGQSFPVQEGTGAMVAYREMLLGAGARDPTAKAALADMLRNYVTLDTLSQLMIFEHWRQRLQM